MLYSSIDFFLAGDGSLAVHRSANACGTFTRMRCEFRHKEDDFFCIRYQVWYSSRDCAVRTKFRTSDGCLDCEQGRFNLKRHDGALRDVRGVLAVRW